MLARVQLTLAAALLIVAVALAGVFFLGPDGDTVRTPDSALGVGPFGFVGAVAPPDVTPRDFTLPDENGRSFSLAAQRGKVVVLTWMYATCLDSCPRTASTIRLALDQVGGAAKDVPVVAVSVDPAGDTRTAVRSFLLKQSLLGRMTYLRGTRAQLRPVWSAYNVLPQGTGTKQKDSHTVYLIIIGRDGRQRVSLAVDTMTPEALAHDLRRVLAEKA